ncbi:MAG TPA: ATP-binding protein [Dongiaceae bacterium]|nr:ATP-binding protein [Dongiaceae bacterium]
MKLDIVFALEHAGWPVLLVDGSNILRRANAAAIKLFGSVLEGSSPGLSAIWSPENSGAADQFLASWERAPAPTVGLKFRAKGGVAVSVLTSICGFSEDGQKYFVLQLLPAGASARTEAKAASGDAGAAQKQKLDCALQLARTVALDFNNALTSILGHTSLVLSQVEANHPWRASLIEVQKSAAKAAEIANDLGTFSRQDKEVRSQAAGNLNLLVQRCVEAFQREGGDEQAVWQLQLERKLFSAKFDEAKMQQAFMKVLENAVQALRSNGRVTVQTRNIELTEATQDLNVRLAAGAYVCVGISDNGCGIAPEVLPRIFEPFFTTKGGTHRGLGLAWVYGIATNHGGGVAVSSQPGAGTSVRLYLPAERRIVKDNGFTLDDLTGGQTILMVDDEDLLLTMGQTILSAYGYRVLTANSGQKALDLIARNPAVDLVITDLVMPAMSGGELIEHLHRLSPATRILCTSGYVWPAGQDHVGTYLQKPFTSQELLLKVKQALAQG